MVKVGRIIAIILLAISFVLFLLAGIYLHKVALDPNILIADTGNLIADLIITIVGITAISSTCMALAVICFIICGIYVIIIILLIVSMIK